MTQNESKHFSWFMDRITERCPSRICLRPFVIYSIDWFYFFGTTEAINYAADTNLYVYRIDLSNLIRRLEHDSLITIHGLNAI